MESGLVSNIATEDAAPRPFCTACWSGLQLGSRPGEWGLRFERLPELCACTLFPSSHRVRCPEHDMKLLTQGRGAQGGADCLPATRSAEPLRQQEAQRRGHPHLQRSDLFSKAPAVGLVRHQPILSQARALTPGRLTLVGLLRAQARIRPAAVVGLVLVRGIASGRAPLYSTAALPPVLSVVPPVGLQLGSRLGVWGLRLEMLP